MKKLIYLPLIAVIVLTGCKSNSFMNQRYTKFGHSSQKKTQAEVALHKEYVKSIEVKTEPVKTEEVLAYSNSPKEVMPASNSTPVILKAKSAIQNTFNEHYSKSTSLFKSETKNLKANKTFKAKSSAARGLVGAALDLVITLITLVVIIFLILLIVAIIT